jgi:hypothetical protein
MAFGSSDPRIKPGKPAALSASRSLARRSKLHAEDQAGGAEVFGLSLDIASRRLVSAAVVLGLLRRHANSVPGSKSHEVFLLLGGAHMHRQAHRAVASAK